MRIADYHEMEWTEELKDLLREAARGRERQIAQGYGIASRARIEYIRLCAGGDEYSDAGFVDMLAERYPVQLATIIRFQLEESDEEGEEGETQPRDAS